MLVLTRRVEERIRIGKDIVVTIIKVKGDRVRVGIEAPPKVTVHREEIFQEILAEKNRDLL